MSVEFRQRSLGEYAKMLKRRKWLVFLPLLAAAVSVGYVVYKLPDFYESKTLLTVKPPTISEKVVQSLSEEDLSQRLQSMSQEVLSRSSLEPMILKYKLFQAERDAGMPMELVIDKMYKNIKVEPERNDQEKVAAFRIAYKDRSPESARNVTAELASKFVNAQVLASTMNAETTREFLDNQLNQAKTRLDELEKQRLDIMLANVETLPDSSQGLIAQLEGLRKREETIAKEKETLITEKGRLFDSIRALNSQMRLIEDFGEKEVGDATRQATRIEDTPAYGQLIQKRAELTAKFENIKTQYKPKHPAYIEVKNQIETVNEELEKLKKNTDRRVSEASQASSRKAELQKQNLLIEKQKVESQIQQIEQQMQYKDQELQFNSGQIAALESKINTIPNVKVALEGVTTQYQTAKQAYDDLLKKRNDAQLQVERESNAQGETIRVVDPANLPQSPVNATKKPMLVLLGAMVGLGFGLFLAGIFEFPRLFKIQNIEDAKHYTGLPVLASVPPLLSHNEIAWQKRAHWFRVLAGIVISIGIIPLLIMGLQATRILERMAS
ncbi:MAG TPA: Wzz/FepE/Etk N-terminal domain-containing protein [Pyrinomonadaceae bacterium]|nr:Wzz/FepE/Etk N-terminal domain-containing protein [Pyrinomonadaceae bacterium]